MRDYAELTGKSLRGYVSLYQTIQTNNTAQLIHTATVRFLTKAENMGGKRNCVLISITALMFGK